MTSAPSVRRRARARRRPGSCPPARARRTRDAAPPPPSRRVADRSKGDGRAVRRARSARRSRRQTARARSAVVLGRTWTTSAPRSSCACAICPTVGNSYSLTTIRFRLAPGSRRRHERADACGDPGGDGDVVGRGVPGARRTRLARPRSLDPEVPLGTVLVPAGEPSSRVADARRGRPASTSST